MAIISLVFAQFFMSINDGRGIFLTTSVGGDCPQGTAGDSCRATFLCSWPKSL